MRTILEDDDIYLEPIKKKPKIAPVTKSKMPPQAPTKQTSILPIRHIPDLKAQAQLFEQLKFTENIQPDTMQSSLKSDYTEWTHSDFLFKITLQSNQIDPDCTERMNQYFRDFNQKCKIYPYMHFVDLKTDNNHKVIKGLPNQYQNFESFENPPPPKIIPLEQKPKIQQKIKIVKIEPK